MPCSIDEPFVGHDGVHSKGPKGQQRQRRQEPRPFQPASPRHRRVRPSSAQAWRLSDAVPIVRRAIGLSMHDIPGRRCASRHSVVAHGRWWRPSDQDAVQSPAPKGPEREKVRSPPVPQTRDTVRTAAWPKVGTSLVACRLPLETIWFRQAATCQQPAQHPRWSSPAQSPTKIAGVQIASLLAAVLVMATAPVRNGGIGAFEGLIATSYIQVLRRPFEIRPICRASLSAGPRQAWPRRLDGPARQPIRQRQSGELHEDAEGRSCLPHGLRDLRRRHPKPSALHRPSL